MGGAGFQKDLGGLAVEHGLLAEASHVSAIDSLEELGLLPRGVFVRQEQRSGFVVVAADEVELAEFKAIVRIARDELRVGASLVSKSCTVPSRRKESQ